MKKLIAFILLLVIALPALAQIRRPAPFPPRIPPRGPGYPYPGPGYPYPGPGYPYPGPGYPYPAPLPPTNYCTGARYEAVLAATERAALAKLESFGMEKGVDCTLTASGFDFARGECFEVTGELYARLRMSFNTNCETRTPTSRLRKTNITYIRN